MNSAGRTSLKWLLALFIAIASTFIALILAFGLSTLAVTSLFTSLAHTRLNVAPALILHVADRLELAATLLLWIVPIALAIGYAVNARWLPRWQWALFSSILLIATFFALLAYSNHERATIVAALLALSLLAAERIASLRNHLNPRPALALQGLALLILFVPSTTHLALAQKLPPIPRQLWSVPLQPGTWQAMNTGSEFGATRQLVFAGDRIVAVFDAGFAPYQGKQPMSRYRIVSLDLNNGAIKNQLEVIGRWGGSPFLFSNSEGNVLLADNPTDHQLQLLKSNLQLITESHAWVDTISTDGTTLAGKNVPGTTTTLLNASNFEPLMTLSGTEPTSISSNAMLNDDTSWPTKYPNDHEFITRTDATGSKLIYHAPCGSRPQFLSSNRILITGCGSIIILNRDGATIATRSDIENAYTFAGVNQQGTRFALQASEGSGDPSHLLYEYFFIYDATTAAPIATIPVTDLPDRQSWTAFSPDGKLFAVGNPNRLTLYQLP